ncbi:MAG: hypothetical protein HY577_02040 [Candidatus Nealsonbacteria bacterium]|nr:hypothetical protein [Candidatus Nealsonbacteria bacterium]
MMNIATFPNEIRTLSFPRFSFKRPIRGLYLCSIGLAASALLIVFCLWQNNQIVRQTYQLHQGQLRVTALQGENETLKLNGLKENTLFKLEKQVQGLNLEKAETVSFIQSSAKTVVSR